MNDTNDTKIISLLKALHEVELERGIYEPSPQTPECPSLARIRDLTLQASGENVAWTSTERAHIEHCAFCRSYVPAMQEFIRRFPVQSASANLEENPLVSEHKKQRPESSLAPVFTRRITDLLRNVGILPQVDSITLDEPRIVLTAKQSKREREQLAGQSGGWFKAKFGAYTSLQPVVVRENDSAVFQQTIIVKDEGITVFGLKEDYEVYALFIEQGGGNLIFNFETLDKDNEPNLSVTIYNGSKSLAAKTINSWGQVEVTLPRTFKAKEAWENLRYEFSLDR